MIYAVLLQGTDFMQVGGVFVSLAQLGLLIKIVFESGKAKQKLDDHDKTLDDHGERILGLEKMPQWKTKAASR